MAYVSSLITPPASDVGTKSGFSTRIVTGNFAYVEWDSTGFSATDKVKLETYDRSNSTWSALSTHTVGTATNFKDVVNLEDSDGKLIRIKGYNSSDAALTNAESRDYFLAKTSLSQTHIDKRGGKHKKPHKLIENDALKIAFDVIEATKSEQVFLPFTEDKLYKVRDFRTAVATVIGSMTETTDYTKTALTPSMTKYGNGLDVWPDDLFKIFCANNHSLVNACDHKVTTDGSSNVISKPHLIYNGFVYNFAETSSDNGVAKADKFEEALITEIALEYLRTKKNEYTSGQPQYSTLETCITDLGAIATIKKNAI